MSDHKPAQPYCKFCFSMYDRWMVFPMIADVYKCGTKHETEDYDLVRGKLEADRWHQSDECKAEVDAV